MAYRYVAVKTSATSHLVSPAPVQISLQLTTKVSSYFQRLTAKKYISCGHKRKQMWQVKHVIVNRRHSKKHKDLIHPAFKEQTVN